MPLPLQGLTNTLYTSQAVDAGTGLPILAVEKPSALIQAVGYLKYTRAKAVGKAVYCRGQRTLHKTFRPTLYRDIKLDSKRKHRDVIINTFLKKIKTDGQFLKAVPEYAREAVLQHYGLRTRWMDVVDNIWVALWFSCHRVHATGRHSEFLHFERRVRGRDGDHAFILLIESASTPIPGKLGYFEDASSSTIDLRIACPSHFIRPHAQHGLLIRAHTHPSEPHLDFSSTIAGIVRVDLDLALEWLGDAQTLRTHAIFPPPVYDYGYRELLDGLNPADKALGRIQHIGA